ncbi:hypothetical protein [Streptomyces sp. 5-10]|uniref:hypothetical protein n=1 Tax=Streptomyces sp. 5-10 TaxID=878925 RepID=UPI00168B447D|nr:hypothetical protein [Streptomyces sp. 5-10]MBD3004559.1 hypothetical protein [Streptomyces sp. 5-10]
MTVETTGVPDQLAEAMVGMMVKGSTLAQIAATVGLPIPVCHERMSAHLDSMATSMSVVQMRMLQLRRLEQILPVLYEQAMSGDFATQGKNIKNLIDLIREITELMDLKKDRLRDEQVRLTQAQTQMVLATVDTLRIEMLDKVREMLNSGATLADIESMWNGTFSEVAATAVEKNSGAMIQVGQGAGPVELTPI